MAQTGYTPILIYSSSTASNTPSASNLTNSTLGSELAINITDGKLFYKDNSGTVQVIAWKVTPTTAGGTGLTSYTAGDTLYYASGTTLSKLAIGSSGYYMSSSGTAPQWSAPAALTKTDDTNVTLTLGGSSSTALLNAASLTLGWTGQLAASRGGTGVGTYIVGDLLYANTTTTLDKLSDVATGNALISGGVSTAPSWGKIGLTTHVSGTLPIANGGTAQTSFTAGQILFGSFSTSSNLYWDNSNVRLGIGTSSPSYNIDIIQTANLSGRIRANTSGVGTYAQLLLETGNTNTGISQAYVKASSTNGGNSGINIILGAQPDGGAAYDLVVGEGTNKTWRPGTDNSTTLGSASYRWSTVYAATASINTSDGTTKTVIGSINDAEKRVAQRIKSGIKKFKFNDSIAKKGDSARIHWGVIAQDVKAAFEAEGLDAEQYALFCSDTWFEKDGQKVWDETNGIINDNVCPEGAIKITRLGVRYEELLAFIIASI
jgi:Chaperone of endosialidase